VKSTSITPKMFLHIAEKYFNDPNCVNPYLGICHHISYEFSKNSQHSKLIYDEMDDFLEQLGYIYGWFTSESGSRYTSTHEAWESRAYMCIFMAEMLKDGTLKNL
jgi:hypothetical protein